MGYTVMIIDDEKWFLTDMLSIVNWEEAGFQIGGIFTKSLGALEKMDEIHPRVVFTDIEMPGLNGFELIQEIKTRLPDCIIIIISAYANFEFAKKAMQLGVTDFLPKPVSKQQVEEVLERIYVQLSADCEIAQEDQNQYNLIKSYVDTHYNRKIRLQDLSDRFFVNRTYICTLFSKNEGITFTQYLTNLRLEKAVELMDNTALTLSEIARNTGFSDVCYFNKVFRQAMNISPSAYRKSKRS